MLPATSGQTDSGPPPWELSALPDGRVFSDTLVDADPAVFRVENPPVACWYARRPLESGQKSHFQMPPPYEGWAEFDGRLVAALEYAGLPVRAEDTVAHERHRGRCRTVTINEIVRTIAGSSTLHAIRQALYHIEFWQGADVAQHRRIKGVFLDVFEKIWRASPP